MSPLRVLAVVALLALPGGLVVLAAKWARERRKATILERMSNGWRKSQRGE
jgi:hypothetical protein